MTERGRKVSYFNFICNDASKCYFIRSKERRINRYTNNHDFYCVLS